MKTNPIPRTLFVLAMLAGVALPALFSAPAALAQTMTPSIPANCTAALNGSLEPYESVTATATSITVTFKDPMPSAFSSSGSLGVEICHKTSGTWATQWLFNAASSPAGTSHTITTATNTAVTISAETDYWIGFGHSTYGNESIWTHIRTPAASTDPTISISGGSAVTEGTAASFTVTRSATATTALTVNLSVSEASGSDFVAATNEGSKTVEIAANQATATYTVATVDDSTDETDGSVTVTVTSGTGYTVGAASSASVTVNDNDGTATAPCAASSNDFWNENNIALTATSTTIKIVLTTTSTTDQTFALCKTGSSSIDRTHTASGKTHTFTGLDADTQYWARAQNVAQGTSSWVPVRTLAAAPGQVTGVMVTPGAGSLDVSWTAVTGATGYKVQWKSGTDDYDATNRQATTTGTSHTIPSLTAGTQYTVRVIATKTNADDGTASSEATGTPKAAAPGQVTGVTVTPGVGNLQVSWTAVTGATGYKVQWKSGMQSYDATNRQATVGAVTSHTIPSLTAGTEYTVRVIATKTNADDGSASAEKTGTPKTTAPGQVTGVSVTPGVGTLDVSWTAVTGATGYKVQWKSGAQSYDATNRQAAVGTVTSHTIPNLTAGTEYTVRVIATKTNADDGTASSEVTGTPKAAAPAKVTGVAATPGVGNLEVTWTAVTGATGYKVQWKSGAESYDATNRQAAVGTVTSHTIPSLTAGTQYTVRVIATKTNADDGPASADVTGTPKATAPGQVTGVIVTPGVGTLAVSWTAVTGATGYKVQWKSGSQSYDATNRQAAVGTVTSHTIPSLTAGTQYTVRVIATKTNADDGTASSEATGTPQAAAPGQVTGVSVTPGVGNLQVSWTAVSGATGYKVQWKSGAESYDTTNRQATATGTSHTITSLTAGTQYTVRVIATLSNANDGDPSAEVTGTPKETAPGQVTGVSVTPGVGTLAVSWTAVTGATGYKVQWKSGAESYDATNRQAAVGTVTSHTIPSLTAGTEYTVRVFATKTNADDGTASAEKTGTPKAAAPVQVTGVTATPAVEALQVTWTAVTGATGYKVQWKSGAQDYDSGRQATVGAVTSHRIPGLTAGTQYTVQVIATKTNADDGPASAEVTGTPKAAAPGQVTGVTATPAAGALQVSWTAVTGATGYKVQWKSGAQDYDSSRQATVGAVTSHTIPGLAAGTQYAVRVIAILSNASDGPPSDEVTGTPNAAIVATPPPRSPPPSSGGGGTVPSPPLTTDTTIDVGENTYAADGHEVTVRRDAGTPAVRLSFPGQVAGDVEVTVSAVAPDVPLESGTFGLGPAGSRTVVDIDIDNVPVGGLKLCLPVSMALREAAAGEPLVLLHWQNGLWTEVPGAAPEATGTLVCATLTAFSPFAVGYRTDLAPQFGAAAVSSLVLVLDEAMKPVVLPQATGGDGELTYSLASGPAGLAGLSFDVASRRLSGTPDTAGNYEFTYTAHDADANREDTDVAALTFAVTVEDPRTAQVRQSVRRTLAAVARRSLSSALDNIGARFAASVPGSSLTLAGETVPLGAIAGTGNAEQWCAPGVPDGYVINPENCAFVTRSMTSEELLNASAFSLTLGASGSSGNSGQSGQSGSGELSSPLWSVWGRGDLGTFAGRPEPGMGYEGELRTGWLGVDARSGAWVAGLALSHGAGEADYDFAAGGASGQGRLETSLIALYPYGRWTLSEGLELRGVLGAGSGEARHRLDGAAGERSDLSMWMGSLGLRREFPSLGGFDLAARVDASLARMETDDGPAHIAGLTADSWRLRAGVEASRRITLEGDAALEPFVEAAARRDGGDGLEGAGLEIAGGVRYTAPRLHIEMRGRWLASHSEEGAEERGVSVTARMGPGAQGRGLSLSLNPRWGAGTGGADALWRDELPGSAGTGSTAVMDARIGYGFSWAPNGLNGLMTPFAETSVSGEDSRRLRLGARFDASRMNLRIELAGERREDGTDVPEHAILLDLRLRF